jgi:predicted ATPase
LGVFVGGCTLEAVEAVCNAAGDLPVDVLEGVTTLIDHSLVQRTEAWQDEPRVTLLETMREYALELAEASGEAEAVRRQHASYYLDLAEQAQASAPGAQQAAAMLRLEADHDNLRAALAWGLGSEVNALGLQLAKALGGTATNWGGWSCRTRTGRRPQRAGAFV